MWLKKLLSSYFLIQLLWISIFSFSLDGIAETDESHWASIVTKLNPQVDEIDENDLLLLAKAFHELKKYKDEVRVLRKVVSQNDQNHELFYRLGMAEKANGEITEAIVHFRQSMKIKKKFRPAYEELLSIFDESHNNYEARIVLKEMDRIFGFDSFLGAFLCRLDSMDGYLESAIKICQKTINKDPHQLSNYFYLAQSLKDKKDEIHAEKVLVRAAKLFPQSEWIQWATGEHYYNQQNCAVALKYYKQAVKMDAKSSRSLLGLARCLVGEKQYESGLNYFHQACALDEKVLDVLREVTGQLRKDKEEEWSRKFSQEVHECKKMVPLANGKTNKSL